MKWEQLSHLSRPEMEELQNKTLRNFVKHELPYSPYYRRLFEEHKITFSDIQTVDDLQKIPFTSKADLAPTKEEPAKARDFILQPDEDLIKKHAPKSKLAKIILGKVTKQDVKRKLEWEYKPVHMHFTTGRTALPTPFTYSQRDVDLFQEAGVRLLDVAQVSRDLMSINAFPYAPHLAFWQVYHALLRLGMTAVHTGGGKVMGTQKIMDSIEKLKAGLVGFIPGYGYHMLREAVKQKRNFSSLKVAISGGERVSMAMKEKVKELLAELGAKDVRYLSTYAMTEGKTAWIQCHEKSGYHLYPDLEVIEVVDKDGRPVKPGEPGEVVYSGIGWRGSVVLRYRTGDMTEGMDIEPCPHCGKTAPRLRMDIQRSSDIKEFNLTKVKGEQINLNNFYTVVNGFKEVEEWQVEIRKKNDDPFDIDEMFLYITPRQGASFADLKPRIQKAVHNEVFVNADVVEKPLNELLSMLGMETELKEKRIVDNRPKD